MQVKISLCCSLKINLINQLVLEMRAGYRQFATVNYSYTSYMYTHTLPAPRVWLPSFILVAVRPSVSVSSLRNLFQTQKCTSLLAKALLINPVATLFPKTFTVLGPRNHPITFYFLMPNWSEASVYLLHFIVKKKRCLLEEGVRNSKCKCFLVRGCRLDC